MGESTRPKGRKIGHLVVLVAVVAVVLGLIRNPEFLMALAAFGPLGMLAIVGWVLIAWLVVKATVGKPKGDGGAAEDSGAEVRGSGGEGHRARRP